MNIYLVVGIIVLILAIAGGLVYYFEYVKKSGTDTETKTKLTKSSTKTETETETETEVETETSTPKMPPPVTFTTTTGTTGTTVTTTGTGNTATITTTPAVPPGTIHWLGNIPNQCLAVSQGMNAKGALGTPIVAAACSQGTTDPNFQFQMNGQQLVWTNNGTYPGLCVGVNGIQNGGANNTPFILSSCPNNTSTDPNLQMSVNGNQLVWSNNGTVPNKCVSVSSGNAVIWDCANNTSTDPNLQFKFGW